VVCIRRIYCEETSQINRTKEVDQKVQKEGIKWKYHKKDIKKNEKELREKQTEKRRHEKNKER
jgi:hypothetical protein